MSSLSIQLPDSLYKSLQKLAEQDGVSLDQFIALAVAEKIAALTTEGYLQERASQGSRASYEAVLAKVPDVEPEPGDQLPPASQS
ncbi:ribbon-helix-helix protein, CopG family [Halomicronema sp. CCY15110]|uniref:ribbon-helix-helix protein, CopG family n=1 Tax=Halomicronema sp. CCY15110 TaxID=2767773 RepID=UPI00194FC21F|nr:ribbon-helix-helix protein, CopG family [Halomicronema sp. CCY15110]